MAIFNAHPLLVELSEWDETSPSKDMRLRGVSFGEDNDTRQKARLLAGKINIVETLQGLLITSRSHVGRVDIGPIRISIKPKLDALPLTHLLRYCYGLKDISSIGRTTTPFEKNGLEDLLISLLAAEAEEFLHRGIPKRYVSVEEDLESPRGKISMQRLAARGGLITAHLPCRFSERSSEWHLNSVLRTGLQLAARMTNNHDLRRHVHRLSSMFVDVRALSDFGEIAINRAEHELSRLTENAKPLLTIIRILVRMLGTSLEASHQSGETPGFLFDMNIFFQRLISRFLRENASDTIIDEQSIRKLFVYIPNENQKRRRPPSPRPDFALYNNQSLSHFLDAKYRDIWVHRFPIEWLYQLTAYSLASPKRVSVILYACISADACDEFIEVRHPVAWSVEKSAKVIMRPVPLLSFAALVGQRDPTKSAVARKALADRLVATV